MKFVFVWFVYLGWYCMYVLLCECCWKCISIMLILLQWYFIDFDAGVFYYVDITAGIFYYIDVIEDIFGYMNVITGIFDYPKCIMLILLQVYFIL